MDRDFKKKVWAAADKLKGQLNLFEDKHELPNHLIWEGDVEEFLDNLGTVPRFDLVVTSPPYNIGKKYERRTSLDLDRCRYERRQ